MNLTINIPRIPSFVKVQNVERVFKDEFDIDVKIDIIIKKDNNQDMEYQMLFVHLVTNEPNERLVEYSKTIESGEEVWFWYTLKHYFKTRKVLNKPRMITKTDMEEIKKGLKSIKVQDAAEEAVVEEAVVEENVKEAEFVDAESDSDSESDSDTDEE